jgi:(1->4)-alpha-D-glucan 1-alpha-D-glucosylmutase
VRRVPASTYRLQLTPSFGFRDAAAIVPYLHELGITDVYLSPPFAAAPGSSHGYDVVDHNTLRPELGGDEGYELLCRAIADAGMGQLVDFVPNHMGIGPENPWWVDLLENGPSSVHAPYFDVDWSPLKRELANKVLVPVLGDQFGEVLERGELVLTREGGAFFIKYWEHAFPVAPRHVPSVIGHRLDELRAALGAADVHVQELESIINALAKLAPRDEVEPAKVAERAREKEVAKRRLAALFDASPATREHIDDNVRLFNGTPGDPASFDLLEQLLDVQAYRLAHWRVAGEEINYRRFFDVNSLAAIRMEDERVFADTHRLVFRLIAEGKVTGLRIDHPDGLYAPAEYFRRLQEAHPGLYVLAEKILEGGERMPRAWAVAGSTGYELLNLVNGLFVDERNGDTCEATYQALSGRRQRWDDLVYETKRALMRGSMASELNMLGHRLNRLSEANRRTRDFTGSALTAALVEYVARLPVYRTYIASGAELDPRDERCIESTIRAARRGLRELNPSIFDFLRSLLLLERPSVDGLEFVRKLQQVTGPVTAKAIEDTACYVYARLVSLNEVGGDPRRFGVSPAQFHAAMLERRRDWPGSLNATATHDTKRGEDTRLRIDALSEIPGEWEERLRLWIELAAPARVEVDGERAPDANDELLIFQTLVGTYPHADRPNDEYRMRVGAYVQKALREAKVHTSWTNPDEAYERAALAFVDALLRSPRFLDELEPFARRVAAAARVSSLAQTALKCVAPGVPDVYQGCELWDLSLVDPDNRRPVDFALRRRMLGELARRLGDGAEARLALAREVTAGLAHGDARAKLWLLHEALRLRRAHPELLHEGEYVPLAVEGEHAAHAVALARVRGDERLVCVVPRLVLQLFDRAARGAASGIAWRGRVPLPSSLRGPLRNVVTGQRVTPREGGITLGELFADFPVALLLVGAKA